VTESAHFDIAIIGAGAGGLVVAAVAANLGHKVVLFEKHKMGGDCLNYGCVPTKASIAASKAFHNVKASEKFGVFTHNEGIDFQKAQQHVQNVIDSIKPHDSQERFEGLGVTVVRGEAKFINSHTVSSGKNLYLASKFVIATGSRPFVPPIKGIDTVPYLTNETILELNKCPEHLIVIGGGPIGCEMAQNYRRMGAKVTIIEATESIMVKEDPALVKILEEQLQKEGISIHTSARVEDIWQSDDGIALNVNQGGVEGKITGSHVLVAAGRKANMESLDLEKAGVKCSKTNIIINKAMQTSKKHIYAIGDVSGPYQFTHMAGYQASIVINRMLFANRFAKANYDAVPWCTYTDPEFAHVGMTAKEAKETYGSKHIRCINLPFGNTDRAKAEAKTTGAINVIFGKKGKILGATILGHMAGEIIQNWAILITHKMTAKDLLKVILPYPTFSEINKQVASEYYKGAFYSKKTAKISRFLFKYFS
jgi:pyruvate/2-oxoglutarate dehydrogenase complex dihydrolipoamide dehydrogenase (E3) component